MTDMHKDTSSGSAKDTAKETKTEVKDAARDVAGSARDVAQDAANAVRDEAQTHAETAKGNVAAEVSNMAEALRTAASEMRDGSPQERTFAQIADGLADASDSIKDKDLGEIASDVSRFAKRNPLVFLGGAALVGFAATRFATASARNEADYSGSTGTSAQGSAHGSERQPVTSSTTPPVSRPTPAIQPGLPGAKANTSGDNA